MSAIERAEHLLTYKRFADPETRDVFLDLLAELKDARKRERTMTIHSDEDIFCECADCLSYGAEDSGRIDD